MKATLNQQDISRLVAAARKAAKQAYAPYSKYKVGSALLSGSGEVFLGCNVENRSFGATICAERSALAQAVSAGCKRFAALAIFSKGREVPRPCGLCLQALSEFVKDLPVFVDHRGKVSHLKFRELYPNPF